MDRRDAAGHMKHDIDIGHRTREGWEVLQRSGGTIPRRAPRGWPHARGSRTRQRTGQPRARNSATKIRTDKAGAPSDECPLHECPTRSDSACLIVLSFRICGVFRGRQEQSRTHGGNSFIDHAAHRRLQWQFSRFCTCLLGNRGHASSGSHSRLQSCRAEAVLQFPVGFVSRRSVLGSADSDRAEGTAELPASSVLRRRRDSDICRLARWQAGAAGSRRSSTTPTTVGTTRSAVSSASSRRSTTKKSSGRLFDAARAWFAERGIEAIRGPMNPSLNYECGLAGRRLRRSALVHDDLQQAVLRAVDRELWLPQGPGHVRLLGSHQHARRSLAATAVAEPDAVRALSAEVPTDDTPQFQRKMSKRFSISTTSRSCRHGASCRCRTAKSRSRPRG